MEVSCSLSDCVSLAPALRTNSCFPCENGDGSDDLGQIKCERSKLQQFTHRSAVTQCQNVSSFRIHLQTRATQSTHVLQTHAGGHQRMQECHDYTMLATEAEPLEPLVHESEPVAADIWVWSAEACFSWTWIWQHAHSCWGLPTVPTGKSLILYRFLSVTWSVTLSVSREEEKSRVVNLSRCLEPRTAEQCFHQSAQ